MNKNDFDWKDHRFGFTWGPLNFRRTCSDPKHGVWVTLVGAKEAVEIRMTKGGSLRIGKKRKPYDFERETPR